MVDDPLPNRPPFVLPFPGGTRCEITTYRGHNPDDKKMDIYAEGWPNDSAAATQKAEQVIADASLTTVPSDFFDALLAALDAPPSPNAALRQLAERPHRVT